MQEQDNGKPEHPVRLPSRPPHGGQDARPGQIRGPSPAYGTTIFYGDPVTTDGAGNIIKATNATSILGVFLGVNFIGADGVPTFSPKWTAGTTPPAGTTVEALICDDEMQAYEVQTTGTITAAGRGKLANVDTAAGGDANTGNSKAGITGVAGSENQWIVERVLELPVNIGGGNIAMSAPVNTQSLRSASPSPPVELRV